MNLGAPALWAIDLAHLSEVENQLLKLLTTVVTIEFIDRHQFPLLPDCSIIPHSF